MRSRPVFILLISRSCHLEGEYIKMEWPLQSSIVLLRFKCLLRRCAYTELLNVHKICVNISKLLISYFSLPPSPFLFPNYCSPFILLVCSVFSFPACPPFPSLLFSSTSSSSTSFPHFFFLFFFFFFFVFFFCCLFYFFFSSSFSFFLFFVFSFSLLLPHSHHYHHLLLLLLLFLILLLLFLFLLLFFYSSSPSPSSSCLPYCSSLYFSHGLFYQLKRGSLYRLTIIVAMIVNQSP